VLLLSFEALFLCFMATGTRFFPPVNYSEKWFLFTFGLYHCRRRCRRPYGCNLSQPLLQSSPGDRFRLQSAILDPRHTKLPRFSGWYKRTGIAESF